MKKINALAAKRPEVRDGYTLFDILHGYLSSDRAPEECMQVSYLDGFLTGMIAGPVRIEPEEWLPVVWGKFDATDWNEDRKELLDLMKMGILARYEEIEEGLKEDPAAFDPYYWEEETGEIDAEEWAVGFVTALGLRMEQWEPLMRHKKAAGLMLPILGLCRTEDGIRYLDEGNDDIGEDDIEDSYLIAMVPEAVVGVYDFWRMREAGYGVAPAKKATKVGRNDPCPCGSGKKYKKCCG